MNSLPPRAPTERPDLLLICLLYPPNRTNFREEQSDPGFLLVVLTLCSHEILQAGPERDGLKDSTSELLSGHYYKEIIDYE